MRHKRISRRLLTIALNLFIISSAFATEPSPLVNTDWLSQHLNDRQVVIIDMSDSFQYQRFHIPGARHLPYNVLNRQSRQRVSYSVGPETITKILGQLGITSKHKVVIYDDTGGLNAARLYWELQRLQHRNAAILDGGLVKWIREGRKVSWTPIESKPAAYPEGQQSANALVATREDVVKAELLLDVRSKEEYQGHPRAPRSGHIPGAIHFPWDTAVDFENSFTMKSAHEIEATLAKMGITDKEKETVLYCRSGHRAAHAYFTLRRLGWKNLRLYDGSMAEYELDTSAPLKMGGTP